MLCGKQPPSRVFFKKLENKGERLEKPSWTSISNHPIWEMVEVCRASEVNKRPNLQDVLKFLTDWSKEPPLYWPSPPPPSEPSFSIPSPPLQILPNSFSSRSLSPPLSPFIPPFIPPLIPPLIPPSLSLFSSPFSLSSPAVSPPSAPPPTPHPGTDADPKRRTATIELLAIELLAQPKSRWRAVKSGTKKQNLFKRCSSWLGSPVYPKRDAVDFFS